MATWIESIDVTKYVNALKQNETQRINDITTLQVGQLTKADTGLTAKISAYGQVQSLFNSLQSKIDTLNKAFTAQSSVSSSDTSVATASISGTVAPGGHDLVVTALAKSEQVASTNTYSSASTALGMSNVLTVTIGSNSFNVTVTTSQSLQDVVSNINSAASAAGMSAFAYVAGTGSSNQLVIASSDSGVSNAVSISETGVGANAFKISMSGPGGAGTGTELTQAKNTAFSLDGISYATATNSNTIGGIAINLVGTGNSTLAVTQTNPVSEVNTAMQDLISTYNDLMTYFTQAQVDNGTDNVLNSIQSFFTTITNANYALLGSMYIVPASGDELPVITGTSASGSSYTTKPIGLLELGNNPGTDPGAIPTDTFLTQLTANFNTFKSNLVGTNGVFTQINNLLTKDSTGKAWYALNRESYSDQDPGGAITAVNKQLTNNVDEIKNIQDRAQKQIDALTKKYIMLADLLAKWQMQTQYMSQQLESLKVNKS